MLRYCQTIFYYFWEKKRYIAMNHTTVYFIKRLLQDALSLNFNYLIPPFEDLSAVDIGLRRGLKSSEELYRNFRDILSGAEHNIFYLYSDRYDINYIFCLPYPDRKDLIVVGPFLRSTIDQSFINFLIEQHHLNHTEIESIRGLLYHFPVIDDNFRLFSIMSDIINYISPGHDFNTRTVDNSPENDMNTPYVPADDYTLNMSSTEERYALEEPLLQAIAQGKTAEALAITRHFMSIVYAPRINDSIADKKASLYSTNTMLRLGAKRSGIHPIFLHELSSKYEKQISMCGSLPQLDRLHEKMVRGYCLLVQNKARSQYSRLVRDTMNYIDLNLSHPLTLRILAENSHVSPSYLSKSFKRETGTTITDHIASCRIHSSLHLLNTTNLPIQEIAFYVGIEDYNYYTKIFKKVIGCPPSEYRKNLKNKKQNEQV